MNRTSNLCGNLNRRHNMELSA